MAFDPDAYLAEGGGVETATSFDPDAYLGTQQPAEEEGFLRQAADIPVNIFKGGVTGVRMVTDVFGAANPISKSLAGVEDYMDTLLSAQAKQDQQEIARILKDAEDKGVLDQVMAGVEAFSVAPADTLANAFGTMIPVLATGLAGSVARLAPVAVKGVQLGMGFAQGVGTAKGEIYNAVYSEIENQGYDPETASQIANKAQAYNGKNLDQILISGGLGAAAASTGAEKILTNVITKAGGKVTGGAIAKAIKGGITEGVPEAVQGGQEKLATNIALQREGVDVPTMRGVVAQATMEGVAGLGMGAAVGPLEPSLPDDVREQRDIERDAEKVARELSVDPNDTNARGIVNETNRLEQKIQNNQVLLNGMEPTSREHKRLSLEIAEDQKNLAALKGAVDKLSEPIAAAEAEQARLAREIAAPVEEAAPAAKPAAPKPLPTDVLPVETPGATYGREAEIFDVFAEVRRKPITPAAEVPAVEVAPVEPTAVAEAPTPITPAPGAEAAPAPVTLPVKEAIISVDKTESFNQDLEQKKDFNPPATPSLQDARSVPDKVAKKGNTLSISGGSQEAVILNNEKSKKKFDEIGYERQDIVLPDDINEKVSERYGQSISNIKSIYSPTWLGAHFHGGIAVSKNVKGTQRGRVVAHELGHASHSLLGDQINKDQEVLSELGKIEQLLYPGLREKIQSSSNPDTRFFNYLLSADELIAEFNVERITNPEKAAQVAPKLTSLLESVEKDKRLVADRKAFPVILGAIRETKERLKVKGLEPREVKDETTDVFARKYRQWSYQAKYTISRAKAGELDWAKMGLEQLKTIYKATKDFVKRTAELSESPELMDYFNELYPEEAPTPTAPTPAAPVEPTAAVEEAPIEPVAEAPAVTPAPVAETPTAAPTPVTPAPAPEVAPAISDETKRKEQIAIQSVDTPKKLNARLQNALDTYGVKNRKSWTIDFENKQLISPDKTTAIKWTTRNNPNEPESYTNQQTSTGKATLVKYQPTPAVSETITPAEEAAPVTPAPAEAPAITTAPVEEAEFAELNDLMERRGQAQSKVKGIKFSKKDEARYNELLPKYRSRLRETITPETDPVVWKDIEGNDIKVSQKGTFYTVENGRVRTGPAFQSEGFITDVSPQPVSAAVVESNNVQLPEGYTKQGDLYVYQPAAAPTPSAPAQPAGISVGSRIKLGKSPQTYTIEEVIPQSEAHKELGKQYYSARNEKTGEVKRVKAKDLKPVKAKGVRKMAARTRNEEYMRLAQDPEANREQLQRMVDEAAKKAGYGINQYSKADFDTWAKTIGELDQAERIAINNSISAEQAIANASISPVMRKVAQSSLERNRKKIQEIQDRKQKGLPPKRLVRGDSRADITVYRGVSGRSIWATDSKQVAQTYGDNVRGLFLEIQNPLVIDAEGSSFRELSFEGSRLDADDLSDIAKERGYDGLIIRNFYDSNTDDGGEIIADHFTVFNPTQIKSADPVTYDDAGNIIPLEERFQPTSPDIRREAATRVKDESLVVPEAERYTFEQAEAEARKLFGGMPEGFIIVNDSVDPEYEFKAGYEPSTGDIILNLAYIRKGESVRNLIAHELGHYAAGDPEIRAKLQEFLDALPATTRAKLERFVERVYNDETGDVRLEEKQVRAFVQMLKAGDQRNAFQKLLDAIKKWLNDKLGTNFQPTDMDAAAVLSGAINRFVSGEKIAREDVEMRKDTEISQMDADYLDAVERGDMETAQRMVDEAAKAAGYDSPKVYHGSTSDIEIFDTNKIPTGDTQGSYFTDSKSYAATRGEPKSFFLKIENPASNEIEFEAGFLAENQTEKPKRGETYRADDGRLYLTRKKTGDFVRNKLESQGYDGVVREIAGATTYIAFNPSQIKSADPVTYDDAGNVIPLSQRFQPTQKDIRYAKVDRSEDVEKDIAIAEQIQSVVNDTISKMPQDQGRDYNAFVNEGKSEAQIAEENNTSVSQVRTNIVRGKKAVGEAIKKAKIDTKAKPKNAVLEWTTGAVKKYFTKEGDLPFGTFQNWVRRNAKLAREAEEARQATQDFYEGLRKLYKINRIKFILDGLSSIPPEDVARFNDALAGEIPINQMPTEIQEPLTRMRQHIDAMSSELIATGQLPEDLEVKVLNNFEVYLTRSYKIFSDPKWINKIPQEKLTAARNFLYQQQSKTDPSFTIKDADRKLEQMLNDWAGEKDMEGKRGGRLGAKDLSVMMTRSEVPKQLRDVMGENTNVIFNYANTIAKISRFVADQQFLDAVKKEGAGKFLFTKDAAPKGFNTLIAPEESRTMAPLSGLRTTPEIAKAFEEFGKAYDAKANPFLYAFGWLNAVGKANLTVGSLFTQARNIIGQPFFFLANGHADLRAINREVERIMKSKGLSKDKARNELVKMAAGEGLVNENAYAGELKEAFEQIGLKTFEDMDADEFSRQFVLLRLFKKGTQGAQKVYQKTDELGKLIGWLNETNRIQKMNPGMSREDAMSLASERTRNTYPTYSQGSEALRLFRRQPFFGPFATFFYETFRTTYWNVVYAFQDINSGTEAGKQEGIKRLAGTMAQIAIGAYLVNAISAMVSGIGDQEEEDVRRMLPPWAANASLVWFPKTKDGVYDFINFSSLNPYNALSDPFVTMMSGFSRGEDPTDIFINAAGTFLSPFTSEQPVTAATIDALRNVTERGTKVYNEEDDLGTKTSKILLHIFGKAFTPGTIDRLRKRIIPAIYGETVGTRAPAPLKEISAEFTGVRFENLDMRQAFQNKAWEFSKAQNDSERIFRDVATRRRRVTEEEQVEAYRRAEESRYQNWQEMYRNYMAVRRAGASKQEAVRLMTDIKISKREASYIARGKYVPYEVSDEVRRRSKLNGNVVPLQEIKAIAREMPRVLEDVQ